MLNDDPVDILLDHVPDEIWHDGCMYSVSVVVETMYEVGWMGDGADIDLVVMAAM